MIRMSIREMVEATGSTLVCGADSPCFVGVQIDSRKVEGSNLFVAFKGEQVDGNRFCDSAIDKGAAAVVVTDEPSPETLVAAERTGAAVVRAKDDDGEEFMLALAEAWRKANPQWVVVGVTGSVGKTTTKEMLAAGIGAVRRVHATKGNFNNLLGVPLTLFAADAADEVLVVEMGMNNAGELTRIAKAARPQVAVITNVGTAHIGLLGSRDNIARAKAEVVEGLVAVAGIEPAVVLSATDDYADFIEKNYAREVGARTFLVGAKDESAVWATDVTLDENGLPSVVVHFGDGTLIEGTLSVPGKAMVFDLLSALGAVEALGLDRQAAFAAIERFSSGKMRLEVKQKGGTCRVIDDSYNASPASMAASIDVLCSMRCDGRRIAVIGEMGELGGEAERLHAMVGAYAAAKDLDLLIIVGGELADVMAEAARTMGYSEDHLERFETASDAARVMAQVFTEDDLVLVKASRAVGLDRFVEEVLDR
jgi:UDP-N-acetylmuramoyl-tripeptide--D-alanyl-D-alanine ligase